MAVELDVMGRLRATSSLVAYWKFDSADLTDKVGGVVMTAGAACTSISGGKFGFGRDYSGVNTTSNSVIPYSAPFATGSMKTISFWFNIQSAPGSTDFMVDNSNTNSGATHFIRMALSSGMVVNWRVAGATSTFEPQDTGVLVTGRWYHYAVTHNGVGSKIVAYLDGVPTGTGTLITEAISTNSIAIYFGRLSVEHGGSGGEPDMILDDIAIYNKPLEQSDISDIATGGRGFIQNITRPRGFGPGLAR